eukprot:scaffold24679_cov20-Tisochrysis_lutea.AAC.2
MEGQFLSSQRADCAGSRRHYPGGCEPCASAWFIHATRAAVRVVYSWACMHNVIRPPPPMTQELQDEQQRRNK